MTSKVYNRFSIKSLSQATRNNISSMFTSAAGRPLRKPFKASSDCSTKSESTASTKQEFGVRFSENIHVHKIISHKDYTPEEFQACWYTTEDNQKIRRHCSKEIRKMDEEGSKLKDKKYCSRGLEGHTTVGAVAKMRNIALATNAVLDEQMTQWEEGVYDEDTIAEIYRRTSSSCQLWAQLVGRRDSQLTGTYVEPCSRRGSGVAPCAA
jgi:hypothetical protein